ncbi:anhydro-N-acetylmuramic acid kinase AnmK [Proteiniclasticum ruminis]|uniref:Anhydro-N-acetylmuramic acid kinase n=1 Tax=Proteiniclasticum ruminis TaxID=398199 RepID=A0A1I5BSZ5_9CLOT|nr:anhydro-N-acetylmuramic acid kinase AnmK [Proteiniclasticum ruminis]SFN77839.1 anhydro-N-acetylmuramic acid kinase [Proteiniclasticum ruminis]
MLAMGLMSGTSLDGVDTALCEITGFGEETKITLIDFETYDFPEHLKNKVKRILRNDEPLLPELTSLNFELGMLFSDAVGKMLEKNKMTGKDLAFVASHGQTIYHQPRDIGSLMSSTLQLGEPAVIAYNHHVDVYANFRVMDMAAGGEGAPLVPYSEEILYREDQRSVALQNIGGIGNVTVLPSRTSGRQVYAFDTGPGNMVIDEAMKILYNQSYDEGGKTALSGHVSQGMLAHLLEHPYLKMSYPKTTGREDFGESYTNSVLQRFSSLQREDLIATLTYFTAKTIAMSYEDFIFPKMRLDKVIIGGGGAHNKALLSYLRELLNGVEVLTQEDLGYSSDAKEAMAFVILGNETYHRRPSNVIGATGAKTPVILGNLTKNPHAHAELKRGRE